MTPTGLWKSCGWTSNTRSAGEKFQNAFLVHRGTGVSVLPGPCLSAVIEWTIQRSWVGPYLKFWLVEILKGTTGFPSYQDIVYVLWTRISAHPKPEGTLSPHLDLPPYPKSQSPPGCCYIFRLGNPKRNSPKTSKLIKTLWQHHLWSEVSTWSVLLTLRCRLWTCPIKHASGACESGTIVTQHWWNLLQGPHHEVDNSQCIYTSWEQKDEQKQQGWIL